MVLDTLIAVVVVVVALLLAALILGPVTVIGWDRPPQTSARVLPFTRGMVRRETRRQPRLLAHETPRVNPREGRPWW